MNHLITEVFTALQSRNEKNQQKAIVQLLMLLERALKLPVMDEKLCSQFLSEDLMALELSASEVDEIFLEATELLQDDGLCRGSKLSLYWLVTDMVESKFAEVVFRFFADHAATFNEGEAFSSIAVLTNFIMKSEESIQHWRSSLIENNIIEHVRGFQSNPSKRLRESATRTGNYLDRIMENES